MQKDFIKINHVKLYNLLVKIFIKYGSNLKIAKKVSHYLTQADLSGQNSHGAARVLLYLEKINDKKYRLSVGPFNSFNTLKSTYISLNNLGFEELNINRK